MKPIKTTVTLLFTFLFALSLTCVSGCDTTVMPQSAPNDSFPHEVPEITLTGQEEPEDGCPDKCPDPDDCPDDEDGKDGKDGKEPPSGPRIRRLPHKPFPIPRPVPKPGV